MRRTLTMLTNEGKMMRRPLLLTAAVGIFVISCGDDDTSATMEFTIETTTTPGAGPVFTATGPAVDEARLCAEGRAEPRQTVYADTGLPESAENPPQDGDVLWVTFDFTCSDGSGDFALRSEATVDTAELESVIQTGEPISAHPFSLLEGMDSYENAEMEGVRQFKVVTPGGFDDGVIDIFTGTITES